MRVLQQLRQVDELGALAAPHGTANDPLARGLDSEAELFSDGLSDGARAADIEILLVVLQALQWVELGIELCPGALVEVHDETQSTTGPRVR